jgi:predicted DNA-binding transcriptional regulator AlpA
VVDVEGSFDLNSGEGDMGKDLYTVQEAMELLGGISRNTIYNLMRDGRPRKCSDRPTALYSRARY